MKKLKKDNIYYVKTRVETNVRNLLKGLYLKTPVTNTCEFL